MAIDYHLGSSITGQEIGWVIGLIVGGMCYGAVVGLGVACLGLLRSSSSKGSTTGSPTRQRWLLQGYILLLLVLNTIMQVNDIQKTIDAVFKTDPASLTRFQLGSFNIIRVLVIILTDGLLVWRCYMVQRALAIENTAYLHHICWILPLLLLVASVSTVIASISFGNSNLPLSEDSNNIQVWLAVAGVLSNVLLNLFATLNIIIRLLLHRRSMIASFGGASPLSKVHLTIVGILLGSAAINIPFAIIFIVGCLAGGGGLWATFLMMLIPAQSIGSISVIYQVAQGRATGPGGEKEARV